MSIFQEVLTQISSELVTESDDLLHLAKAEAEGEIGTVRASIGILPMVCIFHPEHTHQIHRAVWDLAQRLSVFPASIESLYRKAAEGEFANITVPAVNLRAVAFHSACGVFRSMRDSEAGAVIFELSRGEIGFTGQRPHEYAVMILSAAIAEGHVGPVFLQGDHFQVSAGKYRENADAEMQAVKSLIAEAISAGFYNIDIDTSTLVDLSHDTESAQQRLNYECTAVLVQFTRQQEPEGVTISIGGEIGEIGDHNSTVAEVDAYLTGVSELLAGSVGISKLSIQSGTKHGGNVLPDGSFGDMPIEFELITELTERSRISHGLGGCVQHGASMLTLEKIACLPKAGCLEVHLAAVFLNAVYEVLPDDLVKEADDWAIQNFDEEWHPDCSLAQFLHHARRYPIVEFRHSWWAATEYHDMIRDRVGQAAANYISALGASNTQDLVAASVDHGPTQWTAPVDTRADTSLEADMRDLAG